LRIAGSLGLAVIPTVGYVCGVRLYTDVSPLETGMIRVLGGFFFGFFLTAWPTSDE
jgi:hypothetical protein